MRLLILINHLKQKANSIRRPHLQTKIKVQMNNPELGYHLRQENVTPSCLRLSLKTKWFEMTKAGIKTEDYREINEYWFKRLVFQHKKAFRYTYGFDIDLLDKQTIEVALGRIVKDNLKVKMIGFKSIDENEKSKNN